MWAVTATPTIRGANLNDSFKVVDESEEVAESAPLRIRPEAFLVAGLVLISGYLTFFDSTEIKLANRVVYEHPDIWPFTQGTLDLQYEVLAIIIIQIVAVALAAAFFYLQCMRRAYSLKALLGLMVVSGIVFIILSLPNNDLLSNSFLTNLLAVPFVIGGISLIFIILHLLFNTITRSPYSKKRLLDRP